MKCEFSNAKTSACRCDVCGVTPLTHAAVTPGVRVGSLQGLHSLLTRGDGHPLWPVLHAVVMGIDADKRLPQPAATQHPCTAAAAGCHSGDMDDPVTHTRHLYTYSALAVPTDHAVQGAAGLGDPPVYPLLGVSAFLEMTANPDL